MRIRSEVPLAPLTTLRLGGAAAQLAEASSDAEVIDAARAADREGRPVLFLGGGSNVVIADEGFSGLVVCMRQRGIRFRREGERVLLEAAAGEPFDELVSHTVTEGLAGLECLAGIPGSTGAAPIQNIGAYGVELGDGVAGVRVYDRARDQVITFDQAACRFGYRDSRFKAESRWVVLGVTLVLTPSSLSRPIRYGELAARLGVRTGEPAALATARDGVLALRRAKGMIVDPADPDSVSVGSFFTNPVLAPEAFDELVRRAASFDLLHAGEQIPSFAAGSGRRKVPAAWLIERAGFSKGLTVGAVGISSKHALALVHRGGGTTRELLSLARRIRDTVDERFGVRLEPEPALVGTAL